MMGNRQSEVKLLFLVAPFLFCILFFGAVSTSATESVRATFLYNLSNFSGPVPYNRANIHVDEESGEIYVVDTQESDVRIFNEKGMEVYRFGDDERLGRVADVALKKDGKILILSRKVGRYSITLCNFRGEPISELGLKDLPPGFSGFSPTRMTSREGLLYFLDTGSLRIVATDIDGFFRSGFDLGSLLNIEEEKKADIDIGGFSVDSKGNMLFTIPVLFAAYRLSPDGKITGFGRPGSAPGRFGVVGGIVADESGNYYVADRLKSVVLIFDKNFRFLKEFGYRGLKPDNFISPNNLALDRKGRLYVSQLRSRGVSVFKIAYN